MSDSLNDSSSLDEVNTQANNLSTLQHEEVDLEGENCDIDGDQLAYLPCAAHNLQLVIKDALKKLLPLTKSSQL